MLQGHFHIKIKSIRTFTLSLNHMPKTFKETALRLLLLSNLLALSDIDMGTLGYVCHKSFTVFDPLWRIK